jgi:hypothetical protein
VRQVVALLLLILGVQAWLLLTGPNWGHWIQLKILVVALAAGCVPPVRRGLAAILEFISHPSPRQARWTALGVAAGSAVFLWLTALSERRTLEPFWHDQFCYVIQSRMLASGRLWLDWHPLPVFFESFHLLTQPVYAPIYFPGTALLFAPAIKLGLPLWTVSMVAAAAAVGLLYWIVGELLDGASGILAALLLLGTSIFRWASTAIMSQAPALLLELLLIAAFLCWHRSSRRARWEWIVGVLAGWLAITRPLDALCLAGPALMVMSLCGGWGSNKFARLLRLFAGAAPFLALQLIFNVGVTGHVWQTPHSYYGQRDQPGEELGLRAFNPDAHPASSLKKKQMFYDVEYRDVVRQHEAGNWVKLACERLGGTLLGALPQPLLVVLAPLSMLALNRRRGVLYVTLPLFVAAYVFYPFFSLYYCAVVAPAAALMIVMSIEAVGSLWKKHRGGIRAILFLGAAALALAGMPQVDHFIADEPGPPPGTWIGIESKLRDITEPAVVLFHFDSSNAARWVFETDPVYNAQTSCPDDARIIRANDLGERNGELFAYYAQRQPERAIYRCEESTGRLDRLGTAGQLAAGERSQ